MRHVACGSPRARAGCDRADVRGGRGRAEVREGCGRAAIRAGCGGLLCGSEVGGLLCRRAARVLRLGGCCVGRAAVWKGGGRAVCGLLC